MSTSQWQPIESAPKDGTEIILIQFGRNEKGKLFHTRPDYGAYGQWHEDRGHGDYETCEGWMTDYGTGEDWTHYILPPSPPEEST